MVLFGIDISVLNLSLTAESDVTVKSSFSLLSENSFWISIVFGFRVFDSLLPLLPTSVVFILHWLKAARCSLLTDGDYRLAL